jgi:hypothetical protein
MVRVLPLVLAFGLIVYAVIDCWQSPAPAVQVMSKPAWLVVILVVPVFGATAWLLAGRPPRGPAGVGAPRRPLAPDDDPEFLRQLDRIDEEHERMLRQWERDLRRREERLREEDESTDDET